MARWVLFFWVVVFFGAACPAEAAGFSQCNGGSSSTAASCPIMDMTGDQPKFKTFSLPKPIGDIELPEKVYFFSGPLCIVDHSIRTTMEGLYAVFSDGFRKPFTAAVMLYVIVYAVSFMYGLVNPKDFALRLFKLALVWVLVTDNCTFYNYVYGGFISASNDLVFIMSEVNAEACVPPTDPDLPPCPPAPTDVGEGRDQLYKSLDNLFANTVGIDGLIGLGILLLSSMSSDGQGLTNGIFGVLGFGSMAIAMLRAMVTLGIAMAAIAFFLLFAPMFLSFFLFQTTKRLFDNWLSILISFTLQPFIIFAFLGMMRVTIDNAAPTSANINNVMQEAMKMISLKSFEPEMMQGRPSIDVYRLDPVQIKTFGATLTPPLEINPCPDMNNPVPECDNQLAVQQKFFDYFMPKLMFWFFINMIMAIFIKEVPAFAQRLSGFLSAPVLGSSDQSFNGIGLPGIGQGPGGETFSMLGESLRKNQAVRGMAIGGLAIGTAAGLKEALEGGGRIRDGGGIENKAAVGEANREGAQIARVGTLGELLGNKTAGRDGPLAEGINSPKEASRDGTNAAGAGEKDGAARTETTNDNFRLIQQKANEEAQKVSNENVRRGEAFVGGGLEGMNITAPERPEKPTVRRDINLRDIELLKRNETSTTYMLNGKQLEINKKDEEAFLMQKISEINKDMTKTKIMGARGAAELKFSMQQRDILQMRLRVVVAEKRAAESIKQAEERLKINGLSSEEMEKLAKDVPVFVQRQNAPALTQAIAQLKASPQAKEYTQVILDLEELESAMKATTAVRQETVKETAQPVTQKPQPQPQIPAVPRESAQTRFQRIAQKTRLKIQEVKDGLAKSQVTVELNNAVEKLDGIVQRRDLAAMKNAIANLQNSKDAKEYAGMLEELEILQNAMEEARREEMREETRKAALAEQERILKELDQKGFESGLDRLLGEPEPVPMQRQPDDDWTLQNAFGYVGEVVGNVVGGAVGATEAGAEGAVAGSEAAGDMGAMIGQQVGAAGDAILNVVGSTIGVKSEAIVETVATGVSGVAEWGVEAVGGAIGVTKESIYETAQDTIRAAGVAIGTAGREMAEGGAEVGGIAGAIVSAAGGAMMGLVGEELPPEPKATSESFEDYMNRNLDEATGGTMGKVSVEDLAQNMAGAEQSEKSAKGKKKIKVKNPDYNPDDPNSREYEEKEVSE